MERISRNDLIYTKMVLEKLVKIVENEAIFESGIDEKNRDKIRQLMGCQELIEEVLKDT